MAISAGADITARNYGGQGGRLPHLSRYLLRQLLGPVALLALLLTCVVLLTQIFPLLDLVINRGQSAPTFLYLAGLKLPGLLVIILPMAFFFGILSTLSRLNSDSELVVMASAGYSQRQFAGPVFIAAAIVMILTWACALWLAPAGERSYSNKVVDIRADVGGALLNEGEFNTNIKGLTIYIRQLDSSGEFRGVLVHDNRDLKHPVTYIAQKGIWAPQTPAGARLVMFDATVESSEAGGARLTVATFQTLPINLDQFAGAMRPGLRNKSERSLDELFHPSEARVTPQIRAAYLAEAHDRLSQPLYCLAFAMISLAAILRGRRQRGVLAMRLTIASLAALGLRIAGYGVVGAAVAHPALLMLLYAIPLLGTGLALMVLTGYSPRALLARRAVRNEAA